MEYELIIAVCGYAPSKLTLEIYIYVFIQFFSIHGYYTYRYIVIFIYSTLISVLADQLQLPILMIQLE